MNFFGVLIFFVRKVKGEKGRTRNFKNKFKNKKDCFTHFFQKKKKPTNKRTEKERKMAEREKADVVFLNLLDEKQHFSDTSQQESKKNAKIGETIFQDRKNETKQEK